MSFDDQLLAYPQIVDVIFYSLGSVGDHSLLVGLRGAGEEGYGGGHADAGQIGVEGGAGDGEGGVLIEVLLDGGQEAWRRHRGDCVDIAVEGSRLGVEDHFACTGDVVSLMHSAAARNVSKSAAAD